jgi:hypothetical protein
MKVDNYLFEIMVYPELRLSIVFLTPPAVARPLRQKGTPHFSIVVGKSFFALPFISLYILDLAD